MQAVYEQYHDQGLEIIGISSDKTRAALEKYLADNKIPWKQIYFEPSTIDGKRMSLGSKYGIRGIPTLFLIGRDGKVANVDVRGAKLEPAVKQLLEAANSPDVALSEVAKP